MKYDFTIVGSGLFGSVCARELSDRDYKVKVIEKRSHIGGNVYTENIEGVQVHKYGAHIFHTNSKRVWEYVNRFAEFNRFTNSPLAEYKGKLYNLPFNMNTFYQLWGVKTPEEARRYIESQKRDCKVVRPKNLEEQALNLVGRDVYETLIKGYTEKQWGRACADLPAFIIKRIPVRFTYDNNYFSDKYQGVPVGGYTKLVEGLLEGVELELGVDYLENSSFYNQASKKIIYTGPIDEFFNYCEGVLEYRSLDFDTEIKECPDYQGNAVINNTESDVPYTRTIEHKHFDYADSAKTVVTREYPAEWTPGRERYYPVNDEKNTALYAKYKTMALEQKYIVFGGRLAEYKYYDMHQVIASALKSVDRLVEGFNDEV